MDQYVSRSKYKGCCTCIIKEFKIFFQPAKFDNFKDEKISGFKNCLSFTKEKLAGLKTGGLGGLR